MPFNQTPTTYGFIRMPDFYNSIFISSKDKRNSVFLSIKCCQKFIICNIKELEFCSIQCRFCFCISFYKCICKYFCSTTCYWFNIDCFFSTWCSISAWDINCIIVFNSTLSINFCIICNCCFTFIRNFDVQCCSVLRIICRIVSSRIKCYF